MVPARRFICARRSEKFNARVDAKRCVLDIQNKLRGVKAKRDDGTFGELIPHATPVEVPGFVVARGPVATVEIEIEVRILTGSYDLDESIVS